MRLAVDKLLETWSNGHNLSDLKTIVISLPEDLEDSYDRILEGIPVRFRLEGHKMLELISCAQDSPSLEGLMQWLYLVDLPLGKQSTSIWEGAKSQYGDMERRIESCCGELLEICRNSQQSKERPGIYFVEFMHQTVR